MGSIKFAIALLGVGGVFLGWLAYTVQQRRRRLSEPVEREAEFAKSLGIEAAMRDVSCDKICVAIGRKVAVHGVVSIEVAPAGDDVGYRQAARKTRIVSHPVHQLTIGEPR